MHIGIGGRGGLLAAGRPEDSDENGENEENDELNRT
jgi:hypothetical protein